jgi:hypothetical protein
MLTKVPKTVRKTVHEKRKGTVRYSTLFYGTIRYATVWYATVWYATVRYRDGKILMPYGIFNIIY